MLAAKGNYVTESNIEEDSLIEWTEVIVAALDSTVLLFFLVLIFLFVIRNQITTLLKSRNIEFKWGDKHIKLNELSNNLDQEIDPIKDDIETLKEDIRKLQEKEGLLPEKVVTEAAKEDEITQIKKRMYKALGSPKFRWRSIDRLAKFSRTTEEQILELISADDSIQIGYDKLGNKLAKFKHR
jgi:hypothetical protein